MKKLGLIGYPLTHSFSKKYFTEKFKTENINDFEYQNFEIKEAIELLTIINENQNLIGLNITIPHKQSVIEFIENKEEIIREIGAINTIKVKRENNRVRLFGYNTDILGFEMALKPMLRSHHTRALILGNGGASKAVQYVLKELGIDFFIVSRKPQEKNEIAYTSLNKNYIEFHPLIVNTTPIGMNEYLNESPLVPYEFIGEKHFLFDLIYNPEKTLFLKKGEEKGAQISNGITMLIQQAEASWKIWNEK